MSTKQTSKRSHPPLQIWERWLNINHAKLLRGETLPWPPSLPHPLHLGFKKIRMAEKVGQKRDWVLSQADGSRIHIHDYGEGRMQVHRDRYDPARGILHGLAHWFTEAAGGRLVLDLLIGRHKALTARASKKK